MFIPNYQIHNILKAFTQQLRNGHRQSDTGHRLETVVNKVADTIMSRVTYLSEEEARRRTRFSRGHNHLPKHPATEEQATDFHYHTFDEDRRKHKQCLSVKNSEQLIDRFQSLVAGPPEDPSDTE
jgi:hypothetical protein